MKQRVILFFAILAFAINGYANHNMLCVNDDDEDFEEVSKTDLLDNLSESILGRAVIVVQGKQVDICKVWMDNVDKIKEQEDDECQIALKKLTYDDLVRYVIASVEMLAISMKSQFKPGELKDLLMATKVLRKPGLQLLAIGTPEKDIVKKLEAYCEQLPMAKVVKKYKLGKYIW